MMYWVTSLVLLCLIFTQVQCDHGEYTFVIQERKEIIPCISNPINDVCPIDHKIPNATQLTAYINITTITQFRTFLNAKTAPLQRAGGNESCVNITKRFECSKLFYTCRPDAKYINLDFDKAYKLCMSARQECAAVNETILDKMFVCNSFKNASFPRFKRFSFTCKDYPYVQNQTCPRRNNKVPSFWDLTRVETIHKEAQRLLKKHSVTKTCSDAILGAICELGSPGCTYDEKYVVSFIDRKKCREIMGCLNATSKANLTPGATQLCNGLPDADTATKIPIHDIEKPTTPPSTRNDSTTATSTTENPITCCGASKLSTTSYILVVLWFFLANLVN